ncbi:MAG: hypothetical protein AAF383_04530 [Cyanobacteria bacterium P01_A01_bin.83]
MRYDPNQHKRRSIRLPGYDYSQAGYYFVTIYCHQRQCLFGDIVNSAMQLNQYGVILKEEWMRASIIRQEIELDEYVVMPNHFYGIVIINPVGANGGLPLLIAQLELKPAKDEIRLLMFGICSRVTEDISNKYCDYYIDHSSYLKYDYILDSFINTSLNY